MGCSGTHLYIFPTHGNHEIRFIISSQDFFDIPQGIALMPARDIAWHPNRRNLDLYSTKKYRRLLLNFSGVHITILVETTLYAFLQFMLPLPFFQLPKRSDDNTY